MVGSGEIFKIAVWFLYNLKAHKKHISRAQSRSISQKQLMLKLAGNSQVWNLVNYCNRDAGLVCSENT